jgi:hypothetical protein
MKKKERGWQQHPAQPLEKYYNLETVIIEDYIGTLRLTWRR